MVANQARMNPRAPAPAAVATRPIAGSSNDAATRDAAERTGPRKRQRTSQACDYCSKRSIRCQPSADPEDPQRCQNCSDFDVPCTYNRPVRKRGQKKKKKGQLAEGGPSDRPSSSTNTTLVDDSQRESFNASVLDITEDVEIRTLARAWRAFALASDTLMKELVDAYYDIVYPIFPWFHRATLLERLRNKEYLDSRGFFASLMALCALTCARLRDGAPSRRAFSSEPNYEPFYNAAKDAIPKDHTFATGMDFMRAVGLLALTSMQNGQIVSMHCWVGTYHSLSGLERLCDELRWPNNITMVEVEERRCLFWSMYTFEVFIAIVWGGIIRNRESQSQVRYPSAIHDDVIDGEEPSQANSWLWGWNFTTDMYRILEHAMELYRKKRQQLKPELAIAEPLPSNAAMLQQVQDVYFALPLEFKSIPATPIPGDLSAFQAANIQATLALVQMVIFASEREAGYERKCQVAGELLSLLSTVPSMYLKAMGSPLLHHLAGIGSILASAIETPLSDVSYRRARALLLDMASLLESLESGMHRTVGLSAEVRKQVRTMDEYISSQTQTRMRLPTPSTGRAQQTRTAGNATTPSLPGNGHAFDTSLWQFPQELLEWPWSNTSLQNETSQMPSMTYDWDQGDSNGSRQQPAYSVAQVPSIFASQEPSFPNHMQFYHHHHHHHRSPSSSRRDNGTTSPNNPYHDEYPIQENPHPTDHQRLAHRHLSPTREFQQLTAVEPGVGDSSRTMPTISPV